MKRRDFLVKGASVGLGGALVSHFGGLSAVGLPAEQGQFDLVAVRGGEAAAMYEKAMEALGGIEKFVKRGQKVVVKPNIGWDVPPERAGNTNPQLVARIVESCLDAGASEVVVFDHTCDKGKQCYRTSKIEEFARDAGAKVIPGDSESYFREVSVPEGKRLNTVKVHRELQEADVLINVPILKHHNSTTVTLAMKNLMGVVWDRQYYHKNDLSQCIADFVTYRKPDLNIIDGYRMLTRNGPRGVSVSDVSDLKVLIAGKDIVSADAAAARMFGEEPREVSHIRIANEMGLGTMDLDKITIKRIKMG
jgi:uncharacterized protein (DUF362 family)